MNAVTETESAALATLPPAERAALALGSTTTEVALRELIKASAGIVAVTNKDGREECHAAYMRLKNSRVAVGHKVTDATEDAKKFTAAVKTEAARLVAIIGTEEERLQALRDGYDAAEQARKDAEVAAEVDRITKIASALQVIREHGTDVVFIDKTAADTQASIDSLESRQITDTIYQERLTEAVELKTATLAQMREVLATRIAAEAAEAQRLADIAAEDQRRADVAVEQQRVAAEQAATAKKLADQQAALERAAKEQADQAVAAARAQAAALAEAERKARAEAARVAAEAQAKIDAQLAALAEQQAAADARDAAAALAAQIEAAHGEALIDDLARDAEIAARPVPAVFVADDPAPVALVAIPLTDIADALPVDELDPTDEEIKDMGKECGLTLPEWVERLRLFVVAHEGMVEVAA